MTQQQTLTAEPDTTLRAAEILREFGPFDGVDSIHGVTVANGRVWAATGARLLALDATSGAVTGTIEHACDAGTAFDGRYLYQIVESRIDKIDPETGEVLHSIPAPGQGGDSGMAWAEGCLWVGQFRERKIYQLDPDSGEVLRSIESNRFVTGVSWVDQALWHGTWEDEQSEIRRIDPQSGQVLEALSMPPGLVVSGLESGGDGLFYCGGGSSGKVRVVKAAG